MANAVSTIDVRTVKATGILNRQEVIPLDYLPGYYSVRDTATGSGQAHVASSRSCDCEDYRRRGRACKHMIAARAEDEALAQYSAAWDARSEQARATVVQPDYTGVTVPLDDAQPAQARAETGPRCPSCGAQLESRQYYVGGRGYQFFLVCPSDATHASQPA